MIFDKDGWTVDFAIRDDCYELAKDLRDIDKYEVKATGNDEPLEAVITSFERSLFCYTVKHNGSVIMMFGVCPMQLLSQEYICWCLATNEIRRVNGQFIRHCRKFVDALADRYGVMSNWVAVENKIALRWLAWCGFEIGEPRKHGLHGERFRKVVKRRCAH